MIYVFGDSHVGVFTGKNEHLEVHKKGDPWVKSNFGEFLICRIGIHCAYNTPKHTYLTEYIKEQIPKGSKIILSFGEIDIRKHIPKHQNISEVVERYFKFIDNLKDWEIILYLPPATGTKEQNAIGTVVERNIITKEFHKLSIQECKKRKLRYISILNYLLDNNTTKDEYYFDTLHLNNNVLKYIKKQLCKN